MTRFQTVLRHKLEEVYTVEPNDFGSVYVNDWYKWTVSYLKRMPFLYIVPLSIAGTVMMYVLFGTLIVRLASLLQYGF